MGSLRSPGEAGVQESPHRPGSGYAGPSLKMSPVQCPGKGVEAGPGVFMAFPQGPRGQAGRKAESWTAPARGRSWRQHQGQGQGPHPALVPSSLRRLSWGRWGRCLGGGSLHPAGGEGLTQCQPRGRFRKEADGRTLGYHSRVGLCYVPATC